MTTKIRPHGRAKYVIEKCRCEICRSAARAYERKRRRQLAYGRLPYVDAEPVRQHVRALQVAGLGWKRIAAMAGVTTSVVWKLLYGDPARGMAPSKRVRPATAEKILAVQASIDNLAPGLPIDATGTRRRVHALVACGWSQKKLGERIGLTAANFHASITGELVTVDTARKVRALYDQLWNEPPPEQTHREKIAASRARNLARARGWAPPLAWDDDLIDDPAATPEGTAPPARPIRKLPPADELRYLLQADSPELVAARFGVSVKTLRGALTHADQRAAS